MPIVTTRQMLSSQRQHNRLRQKSSEDGAVAIMAPVLIIVMIAMFGMAIDLSLSYNRKAELQIAVDTVALAAAAYLDGTSTGIDTALQEARTIAGSLNFSYNKDTVTWDNAALTFATSADGGPEGWVDAATAKANASRIFFARVDTSVLDPRHGRIQNLFMPVISSALGETTVTALAVAGRESVNVLPLAICANSNTAAASLAATPPLASAELVEYGFRRGVSYNLMNLNPGGTLPENFLVNPVALPGTVGDTMMTRMDVVAPFICTGKMAIPTLRGGDITVERGFPIKSLYVHLNSRFNSYTTPCLSSTAPADQVIKPFDLDNVPWMKDKPDGLSANAVTGTNSLLTVAEQPASATKTAYGPLWSYAKAAMYSDYVAKKGVEPSAGYATFTSADWASLYSPGKPTAQSYSSTPYQGAGGSPTYKLYRNTRVLNVPLLRCPVPSDAKTTATVVGIGKFFMTVPATSSAIYAEFAGMATEPGLSGNTRLYR